MKRTLHILFCLLAALHLGVGHLGVMQAVAWAKMLRDYSAEKGIAQAVRETFDGEHPCAMCCKIAQQKQDEERKEPALPAGRTMDFTKHLAMMPQHELPAPQWSAAVPCPVVQQPELLVAQWDQRPPVPPPRAIS